MTNYYNNGLRTHFVLAQPTGRWTNVFGYDTAKRLTSVTSPAGAFNYTLGAMGAASPLIKKIALPNTSYITNAYDTVARLRFTKLLTSSSSLLDSAQYGNNAGHQRVTFTNAAGTWFTNRYDSIGQLKVADSTVNTEDRGYAYDTAWNVNYRTNNGALSTFQVDPKNQLTNMTAVGTQTYDANGNLSYSSGNYYGYSYDDENRLVNWYYYAGGTNGNGNVTSKDDLRTEFVYDGQGRLRKRVEYWAGGPFGGWSILSDTRYIYDGMRVIQERNGLNNTPTAGYTRGTDLSGSLEGAGGIGGLLSRSHGYSSGTGNWSTHNAYHADGNGNITYLVNNGQTLAASYRYDPFGNTTASSGSLAAANVYRFSSKEIHVKSGLYYYGYRFYSPNMQRWLNRDPIGEEGGINLYCFVGNNPPNSLDPLGLDDLKCQRRQNRWDTVKCQAWCHEAVKLCNRVVRRKALEICFACCDGAGEDKVAGKACIVATAAGCAGGRTVPK